jgi:hypothetical protein
MLDVNRKVTNILLLIAKLLDLVLFSRSVVPNMGNITRIISVIHQEGLRKINESQSRWPVCLSFLGQVLQECDILLDAGGTSVIFFL